MYKTLHKRMYAISSKNGVVSTFVGVVERYTR